MSVSFCPWHGPVTVNQWVGSGVGWDECGGGTCTRFWGRSITPCWVWSPGTFQGTCLEGSFNFVWGPTVRITQVVNPRDARLQITIDWLKLFQFRMDTKNWSGSGTNRTTITTWWTNMRSLLLQLKSSCKIVPFSTDVSSSGNMGETLVQIRDDKRTKGVIPEIH